ncbi:MAG: hypothetical protein ACK4RV_10175 [Caulobacter sp.]
MILVELTAAVDATGELRTFYVADSKLVTTGADTPAHTAFDESLLDPGSISVSAFGDGRTGGGTRLSLGQTRLANADGVYDEWMAYSFDGRAVVIRQGEPGGAYPTDYPAIFTGTAETLNFSLREVVVRLRDRQLIFDTPALPVKYAGTNSLPDGLEGTASDIKGQSKPRLFGGVALNIPAILVNTSKLVYQINNGAVTEIVAVYDRGVSLTFGVDHATSEDLLAATIAGGVFDTCVSEGLFRLGGDPEGLVTADAAQGSDASERTAAQIIKALAMEAGVLEAEISADDVAALDSDCPQPLALWLSGEETFARAMDMVAASVGAFYGFDPAGTLRMARLAAPQGEPALILTSDDVIEPVERLPARDGDIPSWSVTVRHSKLWSVQASDLDAAVTPARRALLSSEYRSERAEDAAVKAQYLLAVEDIRDTLLVSAEDAALEAERLLALYKTRNDLIRLSVPSSMVTEVGVKIMDVVAVTIPRFGMRYGRLFRLLGMELDMVRSRVALTLWGPTPPPLDDITAWLLDTYGFYFLDEVLTDPLDEAVNETYPEIAEV